MKLWVVRVCEFGTSWVGVVGKDELAICFAVTQVTWIAG